MEDAEQAPPRTEGTPLFSNGLPGVRPEYNAAQIPPSPLQSWHDTTGSSEGVWDTNWERQGDEDLFSDADYPKYGSLVDRVRWARENSRNAIDFFFRGIPKVFFRNECMAIVQLISMFIVHIVFIVFGVLFRNDCPREDDIPTYLIVAGCLGLLVAIIDVGKRIYQKETGEVFNDLQTVRVRLFRLFELINGLFMLGWFAMGCYWVFHIDGDYSHHSSSPNYCNKHLYMYSLVACCVQLGLLFIVTTMYCTACWISCCCI